MAVFTEETVRDNLRIRDGKRVFYLAEGDHLTPSAREWLRHEKVDVLPAATAKPNFYRTTDGLLVKEKPEHMTHLKEDLLVAKNHPRIVLRGNIDLLEAELLLVIALANRDNKKDLAAQLKEILDCVRTMMRCEVLEEPFQQTKICGMTMDELREHSHYPQKYYLQPHFMPSAEDNTWILLLNRIRGLLRKTEIAAYEAFLDHNGRIVRSDLLMGYNRLSSLVWILMIREKKGV